jgi:ankyrin repeat protein
MKLNINYLIKIGACSESIEYYYNKYGDKEVDVMAAYNEAKINWQVWFMGNADIDVIQHLINNGADVNIRDNFGYTALIWASFYGHIDIVRLLIDAGADVNASANDGWTALAWAEWNNNTDIVELLRKRSNKRAI